MKKCIALILLLFIASSCDSTKKFKKLEAQNNELMTRLGELEALMNDTDKDGVPDYFDLESNSIAGVMVDTKGRMIDKDINKNGVPDEVEEYLSNSTVNQSNIRIDKPTSTETRTIIKYKQGVTKIINIQSEKLVLPKNLIGNIAFNCPLEMREQQTYEVNARLGSSLFSKKEVQESLLASINESRQENNEKLLTLKDIYTRQINLGYYVKVELKGDPNQFDIQVVGDVNLPTQQVLHLETSDFLKDFFDWKWIVTPKAGSKSKAAVLNLIITPLNKDKIALESKTKTYSIAIKFKQNFFESVWEEMNRNISWAISTIIAPIITFLVGRYLKNRETKVA